VISSSSLARLGKPDPSHPAILVVVCELSSRREHTNGAGDDPDPERRLAPQLAVQMNELGRVGFDNVAWMCYCFYWYEIVARYGDSSLRSK